LSCRHDQASWRYSALDRIDAASESAWDKVNLQGLTSSALGCASGLF
jgi:hypothetical protein